MPFQTVWTFQLYLGLSLTSNNQLVIYLDRACVKTLNVERLGRKILTGGFTDLPWTLRTACTLFRIARTIIKHVWYLGLTMGKITSVLSELKHTSQGQRRMLAMLPGNILTCVATFRKHTNFQNLTKKKIDNCVDRITQKCFSPQLVLPSVFLHVRRYKRNLLDHTYLHFV